MNTFCTFDGSLEHLVDEAVGSNRYKVTVRTQGGHSFGNFGRDNAIEKLAGIIEKLYRIQVPEGGKTTYNVGTISDGTSVNTIAQEASMLYEFRSDRKVNLAYMEEKFEAAVNEAKAVGLDITYEILGIRPCSGDVDKERQARLLERAKAAVETVTGICPGVGSGSTDCNIPLSTGVPSICFGGHMGTGAHTREEFLNVKDLRLGMEIVAAFMMDCFN